MARGVRHRAWTGEIALALTEGLDDEYTGAIKRSQSLLVAVDELRLPGFLLDDPVLQRVDSDELRLAIQSWGELCASQLDQLRSDTEACAYFGNEIADDSRIEYCARISRAEEGFKKSLYRDFLTDGSES